MNKHHKLESRSFWIARDSDYYGRYFIAEANDKCVPYLDNKTGLWTLDIHSRVDFFRVDPNLFESVTGFNLRHGAGPFSTRLVVEEEPHGKA